MSEGKNKAEAFYGVYKAALDENKWDAALQALFLAAKYDPERFRPFPLDRFEPKRIVGAGGFGTVFLCHDKHSKEDVAIRTLHSIHLDRRVDEVFKEARVLSTLSHPAIIHVRESGYAGAATQANPYIVMDYFAGISLELFVQARGPLTAKQLVSVALEIAQGMQVAHDHGIFHGNLKPANILVQLEGDHWHVKIIDFGLAAMRQTISTTFAFASVGQTILAKSIAGSLPYWA